MKKDIRTKCIFPVNLLDHIEVIFCNKQTYNYTPGEPPLCTEHVGKNLKEAMSKLIFRTGL